jgi:hypothetical protein
MAATTYRPRPKKKRPAKKQRRRGITYAGQQTTHQTDGLSGYPAVDIFAPPGTPFLAPENGRIVRLSGHPGTHSGNVYGQSVYFKGVSGTMYFITHLGTVSPLGSYRSGAVLGTVSRWDSGATHAHVGINTSGGSTTYGDTRSSSGQTQQYGTPAGQTQQLGAPAGLTQQYGMVPPTDPGVPGPPMPELPGSASIAPTDPSQAWRMIAAQPLSSPEAQRWAMLMGGNEAA